ncbi:hypothetical protein KUTeg_019875 [Tegillarca granosa]|uniref:PH domain-containing protein n=1 Tax=Tegillarca granosa TaxID=220873 RepID=A0ABQ9EFS6_TEGGR|nr:hypothetical protein KUTeg_019875 [Tegillarca granosa]
MGHVVKSGYLKRYSKSILSGGWQNVWVVLYQDSNLYLYKRQGDNDIKGKVFMKQQQHHSQPHHQPQTSQPVASAPVPYPSGPPMPGGGGGGPSPSGYQPPPGGAAPYPTHQSNPYPQQGLIGGAALGYGASRMMGGFGGWGFGRHGSWSSLSSFGSCGSFGSFGSFD